MLGGSPSQPRCHGRQEARKCCKHPERADQIQPLPLVSALEISNRKGREERQEDRQAEWVKPRFARRLMPVDPTVLLSINGSRFSSRSWRPSR